MNIAGFYVSFAVLCVVLPGCCVAPIHVPSVASIHDYTIAARSSIWIPRVLGDVLHAKQGQPGTTLDLKDDLGVDDYEIDPLGSIRARFDRHDLNLDIFYHDTSGSESLDEAKDFGDLTLPPDFAVQTDVEILAIGLKYGYSFFTCEDQGFRLGPTIGLSYYGFRVSVETPTVGRKETMRADLPVPGIGARFELPIERFLIGVEGGAFYLSADDLDGFCLDVAGTITWRPLDHVGIMAGYRAATYDIEVDSRDLTELDTTLAGPLIGVEFRF